MNNADIVRTIVIEILRQYNDAIFFDRRFNPLDWKIVTFKEYNIRNNICIHSSLYDECFLIVQEINDCYISVSGLHSDDNILNQIIFTAQTIYMLSI